VSASGASPRAERAGSAVIDPARLVFVAGLHRSGTTPLTRLLAEHPEISGFSGTGAKEDEGQHLQDVYPAAREYGGAGRFAHDPRAHLTEDSPLATPANADRLLEQWSRHWDLGRRLLLEKSPPNLVMTRFLQALYPDARFVVVVRHPVVVALSTLKWSGPTTRTGRLVEHWLRAHETFLADAARLRNVHVVRYEDLVSEPRRTLDALGDFLDLEEPLSDASFDGRRSDAYVDTWRRMRTSSSPLTRLRVDRLRRRYARGVERFGYDFDELGVTGPFPLPAPRSVVPLVPRAADRLRVLYVGGMPRSGSTLTDLMLHQLPGHVGVGELFYLWRNCVAADGLCACGEPFSRCAFWTEVGQVAFGGWDTVDAAHVMRLQARVDRTARIPLLLAPRRPRRFEADLAEYTGLLRRLYAAVAEVSGQQVVVDSSKRPSLAYVLRTMPDVDLRVVQVVRDPRGVAFSFTKHVALPQGAALRDEMPRSSTRKVSRRWVTVNLSVAALARVGVEVTRVRYEDLVADPRTSLRRILALTSDRPEDAASADLGWVDPDSVTVPRTHVVAAGRIRLHDGSMPLRLDEQWRSDLPADDRRLVELVTAPLRRWYGYA
jgi:hypothetical protein